jgi:hypothetical protein
MAQSVGTWTGWMQLEQTMNGVLSGLADGSVCSEDAIHLMKGKRYWSLLLCCQSGFLLYKHKRVHQKSNSDKTYKSEMVAGERRIKT